ncbi:MAG TPA: sugar ABC transporter permease [Candidatus Limnocylindrales bacterium]|nr:sugar ABC transporter permease [Candidatus Limnocylindrales bacterium]
MDQVPAILGPSSPTLAGARRRRRFGLHWRKLSPIARREARQGYLYILPWILGFLAFTLLPMIATLVMTFLNVTLSQEVPLGFVGLDNWTRLFRDKDVWDSLSVTLRFALLWLPISIVVPFAIALGLNAKSIRGAGIMRSLFFMPYVVPFVAGVLVWEQLLGDDGWINGALRILGVENPPSWLYDSTAVFPALAIVGIWGIGAGILINLAGLRGIPTELYEASRIDGAGAWAQLRNVTIPMMSPILFYTLILGVVEVLQYFLVPLVLKNGTGEPGGQTLFYNLNLYKTFFTYQQLSYGATMAWLLFGITLVITLALFALSRRWVYYAGER